MRVTKAIIHLGRVASNFRAIQSSVGPGVGIMPVVKADAYGHGAVPVAQALVGEGAGVLAVAILEEAIELREAGIDAQIVLLGATFAEEADAIIDYGLTPMVMDGNVARALSDAAKRRRIRLNVHVKVDTGMGRLGIQKERALEEIEKLAHLSHLAIQGICTHFPSADEEDLSFTTSQVDAFERIVQGLEERGVFIPLKHTSNSDAILSLKRSHFNMVRPGILLYGLYPSPDSRRTIEVEPVLRLVSQIAFRKRVSAGTPISYGRTCVTQRATDIAVIPIGYADGYPRHLSNKAAVKIGNHFAQVLGRVCMDQIVVDVTGLKEAEVGSEVVVYSDRREEPNSVESIARLAETIPYEITTRISKRVPREFIPE